jgi:hypothetical protein
MNLPAKLPKVGLQLEFRDLDFIWSPATVIASHPSTSTVTLRYDGWPSDWDEQVPYPNERLARRFTYTKQLRAWVKSRGVYGRWPAMVVREPSEASERSEVWARAKVWARERSGLEGGLGSSEGLGQEREER